MNYKKLYPTGEAKDILMKYTDSAKIKSELQAEKMLDFSLSKYNFNHFPDKILVTVYDKEKKKTFLTADSATSYNTTKIIEFFGKVKINFTDGKKMTTSHLYYDQKNNWFYTENHFKITGKDSYLEGDGLDFDSEFKIITSQKNKGIFKNKSKNENL